MSSNRFVKVLHTTDGQFIYQSICDLFAADTSISVDNNPAELPQSHHSALVIFVVTDDSVNDVSFRDTLTKAEQSGLPILPVIPLIADYNFANLPASLQFIKNRNAIGWDQGAKPGEAVIETIYRYLGLRPFKRYCKVFISYRRSDATQVAQPIYHHLFNRGYRVFLDTETIEPGEIIQDRISEEISEHDFLLLIDSPAAAESDWVKEEISQAMIRRVSVCALRLPESTGFPFMRDMPTLFWEPEDQDRLLHLERYIARAIASKTDFDQRIDRLLREFAHLYHCQLVTAEKRKMELSRGDKTVVVEFEDASLSLDRLFRLHQSFIQHPVQPDTAMFVHNGLPLSPYEREALQWARRDETLESVAASELFSHLMAQFQD